MLYYKYIDENTIEQMPDYIIEDNIVIANPPLEKLFALGYNKEVVYEAYPTTEDGYYRLTKYVLNDDKIIRTWSEPIKIEE